MKVAASTQTMPPAEPRLAIPALASFYSLVRDLSYPLMRATVGAILLVHEIAKLMGPGVFAIASGLARRGIEPSVLFARLVFLNETVGAICLVLGLFTRPIAASVAIEMAVVTFDVHFRNGFGFTSHGGGWEYPLMWGLFTFGIALRGGGPYSLDRKLGVEL